jgi:hypothetical protein
LLEGSRLPRAASASLEGSRLPRAGSASLEGSCFLRASSASLEGSSPPHSRPPHEHTRSRTRVQAFNALTQQSRAIVRLRITPRRCSADSLGGKPSPPLWGTVRHGQCQLRGTVPPTPVWLMRRSLEGGAGHTLEPLSRESTGSNHDARPAGSHPRHSGSCAAAPVPAAPCRELLQQLHRCRAHGDGTPPRLPLYPVRITVNGFLKPV